MVIPAYNAAGYLEECLKNLSRSTCADFECIVVDDGSTDATAEVARRWGARVLATEGRRGPAHARNLGAKAATAGILFFIDSDVSVYPSTVARMLEDF